LLFWKIVTLVTNANEFDQSHLILNGLSEQHAANRLEEVSTSDTVNPCIGIVAT
jgi:hypothetical protein